MMTPYHSFETERLILRPTNEEDGAFIRELLNTPKWLQYIGDRNVHTEQDGLAYIQEKMTPQLEKLGYGNYTVIRKSDQIKIGTCGLYDRDGLDGIDIGFAFLPAYEKKGYAFEASKKILDAAIHLFAIGKISAITTKDNIDSQNLLKKLGLQFEKEINLPEDEAELLLYQWQGS